MFLNHVFEQNYFTIMFRLFKKKTEELPMVDLDGQALAPGDRVESLRYDLGICLIVKGSDGIIYESLETSKQVSWVKMVDASTKFQKVIKIK